MQKIHFQNEHVRPSHVMGLHKILYTRETWHAKLKNTLAGLAQSKDRQPQHFRILSLVLHCRGQVLTPELLSLSVLFIRDNVGQKCLVPLLSHILPCVINQYSLYCFVQICFNYHPQNSTSVQPQYLSECHQNVKLHE